MNYKKLEYFSNLAYSIAILIAGISVLIFKDLSIGRSLSQVSLMMNLAVIFFIIVIVGITLSLLVFIFRLKEKNWDNNYLFNAIFTIGFIFILNIVLEVKLLPF